jgi:hypothetical protein
MGQSEDCWLSASIIARLVVAISPVLLRVRLIVRERDKVNEEEK